MARTHAQLLAQLDVGLCALASECRTRSSGLLKAPAGKALIEALGGQWNRQRDHQAPPRLGGLAHYPRKAGALAQRLGGVSASGAIEQGRA